MLADPLHPVYRRAMAQDHERRRVKVRSAVLAWRFDPATIRQAFDRFAAGPAATPSVRSFVARGLE